MLDDILIFALPAAAVTGLLLALTAGLPSRTRGAATVILLSGMLACLIFTLLSQNAVIAFAITDAALLSMLLLAAALGIAPLLDRARSPSLLLAAPASAFALMAGLSARLDVPPAQLLLALVFAASLCGLAGSAVLPLHPLRFTVHGQPRSHITPQALGLAGWSLVALMLIGLVHVLAPTASITALVLCAATAAFVNLLTCDAEDGLAKAGEGFVAGVLIACVSPATPLVAALLGVLAGFMVNRSEAITSSLRIDDAQHLAGTCLLPACAGLLLPGVFDASLIASQLHVMGISLLVSGMLAALLWPLLMATLGLALPRERVLARASAH
jgi:hypothetical protein